MLWVLPSEQLTHTSTLLQQNLQVGLWCAHTREAEQLCAHCLLPCALSEGKLLFPMLCPSGGLWGCYESCWLRPSGFPPGSSMCVPCPGRCSISGCCCVVTEEFAGRLGAIHWEQESDWKQLLTYAHRPMHFYEDSLSSGRDKRAMGNGNRAVQWKK